MGAGGGNAHSPGLSELLDPPGLGFGLSPSFPLGLEMSEGAGDACFPLVGIVLLPELISWCQGSSQPGRLYCSEDMRRLCCVGEYRANPDRNDPSESVGSRAQEIAQLVKCLPYKLSSIPGTYVKRWVWKHALVVSVMCRQRKECP